MLEPQASEAQRLHRDLQQKLKRLDTASQRMESNPAFRTDVESLRRLLSEMSNRIQNADWELNSDSEQAHLGRALEIGAMALPLARALDLEVINALMAHTVRDSVRVDQPGEWVLDVSGRWLGTKATERCFSQLVRDLRVDVLSAQKAKSRRQVAAAFVIGYWAIAETAGVRRAAQWLVLLWAGLLYILKHLP